MRSRAWARDAGTAAITISAKSCLMVVPVAAVMMGRVGAMAPVHRAFTKISLARYRKARELLDRIFGAALGTLGGRRVVTGDPLFKAVLAGGACVFVERRHAVSSLARACGAVLTP